MRVGQECIAKCLRGTPELLQLVCANRMPNLITTGLSLFTRDSGLESADNLQPPGAPLFEIVPVRRNDRLHRHRDENCRIVSAHNTVKAKGSNTNHSEWMSIDGNTLVDNLRV